MSVVGATRFKPGAINEYEGYVKAAQDYIANLTSHERRGLREKPLDWHPGHLSYFTAMYQLLNGIQLLALPPSARIVEVGSGAGWATEILASLQYRVDCIEPSSEMTEVAKLRVREHLDHHGVGDLVANVAWHCTTMEEASLPDETADAVMFFESFHHVVDESKALDKVMRALKPGGQVIILCDPNWIPGNAEQEAAWTAEMEALGTLESPLTHEYMLWLLEDRGFTDIVRHHAVNTLVPVARESEPVRNFAQLNATYLNLVVARKPRPGDSAPPRQTTERPPRTIVGALWRAIAR